jgi:hypothetical protein
MKNWKTTVGGIISGALVVLALVQKLLNGEPITYAEITAAAAIFSNASALLFARDAATIETTISQPMKPSGPAKIETTV